jgi:hypothetical protein
MDNTQLNNNNNISINNLEKSSKNLVKKNIDISLSYHSYYYSNQNIILNARVMSYEEQLQKAICKGNLELCHELIKLDCNLNLQKNRKLPLGIACEYNYYDIVELLLKVLFSKSGFMIYNY